MQTITLISDFGDNDFYTAILKTQLCFSTKKCHLIEHTNKAPKKEILSTTLLLDRTYQHCPQGSIHLFLVDVFYQEKPSFIWFEKDGHYFVGPDNGRLSIFHGDTIKHAFLLCHDLDILKIIEHLIGFVNTSNTEKTTKYDRFPSPRLLHHSQPSLNKNIISTQVIRVDDHGNVMFDITKARFDELVQANTFHAFIGTHQISTIGHSAYSQQGCQLYFNSLGYLELTVNLGNASKLLQLTPQKTILIAVGHHPFLQGFPSNTNNLFT